MNANYDYTGILCIISTDKDFTVISPTSCITCYENKLKCKVLDVHPLQKSDCNDWRKCGVSFYNVKCECGDVIINKHWKHRLKISSPTQLATNLPEAN